MIDTGEVGACWAVGAGDSGRSALPRKVPACRVVGKHPAWFQKL